MPKVLGSHKLNMFCLLRAFLLLASDSKCFQVKTNVDRLSLRELLMYFSLCYQIPQDITCGTYYMTLVLTLDLITLLLHDIHEHIYL